MKGKYILGINSIYHDSSACLLKNGVLVSAVEEERFTKIKHAKPAKVSNGGVLPVNSINFCLEQSGIKLSDVDYIAVSFNPEIRLKNIGIDKYFNKDDWGSKEGEERFYNDIMTIPKQLSDMAGEDISKKFVWVDHHMAHAASIFFVSLCEESLILVVDGIGEISATSIGIGKGNKIEIFKEINYPHSIGFLWERISEYLGFTEYEAGIVMGLSSYGDQKKYKKQFEKLVKFDSKNIYTVDIDILRFRVWDFTQLEKLFGIKKREKNEEITQEHMDIAAGLQYITEKVTFELIKYATKEHPSKYICLAGGVALNCVANEEVFQKFLFKDVYLTSAPNDAGTSIGAAYYVWNQMLNKKRKFVYTHAFWGPEYSNTQIENKLKSRKNDLEFTKEKNIEKKAAELIADGKIVAWFQGKLEFGPRALGNRSILADPRNKDMLDIINKKVKKREWFRPFAPSVMEDLVNDFFVFPKQPEPLFSDRFMIFAVEPKYPEDIPAVVHVDNTCRFQTVPKDFNPKYYKLINEFYKITGIPIVLNTSFNIQEPIVCSPQDAINTFKRSKIDYLIMNNYLIKNKPQ